MPDATAAPSPIIQLPDIWPRNARIPVFGAAGELNSGKTLLGLSIDPQNTICYDLEKSSESYLGLGFTRVDVPDEMLKLHPNGYSPLDVFIFLRDHIMSIPKGKYTVGMIDPITDAETGLVDFVKASPEKFGKTAGQYERASGLLWGDVKNYWKSILLDFTSRFQTFYFTAHMRQVWKGSSPTSRRQPQGKDTLQKLASLYLLLDRLPDKKGNVPEKPRGRVLKSRLSHTQIVAGLPDIQPILPPQLPEATPAAIRNYINKPPSYGALKAREKIPEERLSEDQVLELKADIAQNEFDAETMRASRFEQMESAAKILHKKKEDKKATKTVDEVSAAKPTEGKLDAARAQDAPPSASPFKPAPKAADFPVPEKDSEKAGADLLSDAEMAALKEREHLDETHAVGVPVPPAALPDGTLNSAIVERIVYQFEVIGMTEGQKAGACRKRGASSGKPTDLAPGKALELVHAMETHLAKLKSIEDSKK